MLPTHQRLCPSDLVVIQCYDGLIVDSELLPYEGSPEPRLQCQALYGLSIHAGLEHLVASLASMFGSVHRQVRVPQEIRRLLRSTTECDPDADSGSNLMLIESEGRLQALCDPLRESNCVMYPINLLDKYGELVPAEPSDGILRTQASL